MHTYIQSVFIYLDLRYERYIVFSNFFTWSSMYTPQTYGYLPSRKARDTHAKPTVTFPAARARFVYDYALYKFTFIFVRAGAAHILE